MSTEIVRPTGAYNPDAWASPANGYDDNDATAASKTNPASTPSVSYGGSVGGESTNAWGAKAQVWDSATAKIIFSKTAGTDDTVSITIVTKTGTLKHTILAATVGAVTKQTFSQALSSADWGGSGFPNIADLRVRVNGVTGGAGPDGASAYVYEVWIEGEYILSTTQAENIAIAEALKFLAGKALAEGVSLTEILSMLVQPNYTESVAIADACEALKVIISTQAETITLGDFIDLLSGRVLSEGVTMTDAILFLAQAVRSEALTITDTMNLLTQVSHTEGITVADAIAKLVIKMRGETVTISDIMSSYIFVPNNPLARYGTRVLVDMQFDSGTEYYSTEDIYIEEP